MTSANKVWLALGLGGLFFSGTALLFGVLFVAAAAGVSLGGNTPPSGGGSNTSVASAIPKVLQPIFLNAANKHNMSVNFLASIFWKEHGESFPTQGPWATSGAGAEGPFQFEPSTWASHAEDCNNDGVEDVQNLYDASCGAADLLAAIGARGVFDTSPDSLSSLRDAASKYNSGQPWSVGQNIPETHDYVTSIIPEYVKLVGSG
jgi:hypothetical protein